MSFAGLSMPNYNTDASRRLCCLYTPYPHIAFYFTFATLVRVPDLRLHQGNHPSKENYVSYVLSHSRKVQQPAVQEHDDLWYWPTIRCRRY